MGVKMAISHAWRCVGVTAGQRCRQSYCCAAAGTFGSDQLNVRQPIYFLRISAANATGPFREVDCRIAPNADFQQSEFSQLPIDRTDVIVPVSEKA
jgi:hypothetical protein